MKSAFESAKSATYPAVLTQNPGEAVSQRDEVREEIRTKMSAHVLSAKSTMVTDSHGYPTNVDDDGNHIIEIVPLGTTKSHDLKPGDVGHSDRSMYPATLR